MHCLFYAADLVVRWSTLYLLPGLKRMVVHLFKRLFNRRVAVHAKSSALVSDDVMLQTANDAIARGDLGEAAQQLGLLVDSGSKNPDVYDSFGYVLIQLKDYKRARVVLQSAVALDPYCADAHYMLGKVCLALNDSDAAEQAWASCFALTHELEALYGDYCLLLFKKGKIEQAKKLMQTGNEQHPNNADIYFFQGNLHSELGEYEPAVVAYQYAMAIGPATAHLLSHYANALHHTGSLARAIELSTIAVQQAPESASFLSSYLFSIQYSSFFSKAQRFAAHLEYAQKFELPVRSHWGNYKNNLAVDRKIRVGYVSGDFRNHSLIFFILPILANHNKSKFEVYGYYNYPLSDVETSKVKALCDVWVACHDASDDTLEARIRADKIDILVDLSGHTAYNRLLTFARKPAPIQMTWLGYQSTTGLSAIDYRITEEALDPSGTSEAFHSEKLLRLPSSGTFSPLPDSPPVNELPALNGAPFTFACLNNPSKITDEVIALWAQILIAAPTSRLMIGNATPALTEKLSAQFLSLAVQPSRLLFKPKVGLREYLQLHHDVDLALDTFPYNGGTTTFHSLWMGVPIVALEGNTALSKVGATIMRGLGFQQFCGASAQAYVATAVYFASHVAELGHVRLSLRGEMDKAMQLLAEQVTGYLETSFEACWRTYCEKSLSESSKTGVQ